MKHIAIVAGARPNFIKVAPLLKLLDEQPSVSTFFIHTGQHYDRNLSSVFFEQLGIRPPDVELRIGSGSHGKQTAEILIAVEQLLMDRLQQHKLDWLIVVGDVNSTLAAALAATKLGVRVAHVEAGLRSGDRTMPEEINRLMVDAISDLLLCSEPAGVTNLQHEGHDMTRVHLVGNVMIDTLKHQVERAQSSPVLADLGVSAGQYGVATLHRPANVDDRHSLRALLDVLADVASEMPIVFPVHPRTKNRILEFGLDSMLQSVPNLKITEPLGYIDFLCLTSQAKAVVTDSGGLQEETTALGVPCLTMRENTERPITCSEGTGTLIGNSAERLHYYLRRILDGSYKAGQCPALWDGHAADRIVERLLAS